MFIKSEVPNADLKTNEGFRSFVQHVRNVLTTVNPAILTRTADTGQIDPLTVNTPLTSSGTTNFRTSGFDIYHFNDSLQPLYFKLEYGAWGRTGSYTSKMEYGLYVTIGTGSDGAGNITQQIFSGFLRKTTYSSGSWTTQISDRGVHYTFCCVKDGYLSFHFDVGSLPAGTPYPNAALTTESHSLIISRDKNAPVFLFAVNSSPDSGTTSDASSNPTMTSRPRDLRMFVVNFTPGRYWTYVNQVDSWSAYIPGSSGVVGADIGVKQLEVHTNDDIYKDENLLMYWGDDFGYEQQETVTIDGVPGNFLFLTPALRTAYPYMNIAIRWE